PGARGCLGRGGSSGAEDAYNSRFVSHVLADEVVRLSDGRHLSYTEWGDPGGPPVLFFHGTPGSRLWCPNEAHVQSAGVRLVCCDRPGYGGSDPVLGRAVADRARDVAEFCDRLGIESFGVIGASGGVPYALAVGALMPDRAWAV